MEEGHGERFHLDIVEFYLYPESSIMYIERE